MTSSNPSRTGSRIFLPVAAVVLIGLVLLAISRRPLGERSGEKPDDGLTYEQRVIPLVDEGAKIVARLQSTNTMAEALRNGADLRQKWQDARTGRGYDRARHDGFILTFSQFLNAVQSAEILQSVLKDASDAGGGIPENRRTEVLFTLQGIHGAETGAQLISKTGLTVDALMSRTNLTREVETAVRKAIEQYRKATQVLTQLEADKPL